ncbi:glycoside hydrolase family 88 protein [Streptomyces sp. ODS28]|uniref:glycoside hydrolase family 88 protein n=1 Tax=Streptomyces sp. ODS28 TaxID=3136688 RepID=UPI0031EE01C7
MHSRHTGPGMSRRRFLAGAGGAALATALASPATAAALPSRAEIAEALHRAAGQWIAAHREPGDNGWARATFFSGLLALHRLTGEPRHLRYARGWAESHAYGLLHGVTTRHPDDHAAGQAYLDLYEADGGRDRSQIAAIETSLHRMVFTDRPEKDDDWSWDDALHMAMPPFARLAVLRDEPGYARKLHRLYAHTKHAEGGTGLYDAGRGLWYRDKRFLPGGTYSPTGKPVLSPTGRPVLWSRGNGWVAGGHVKTLAALSRGSARTAAHAAEYRATLARLLGAVLRAQRPDGFWNVNLADPAHLPGPETSGTAFFAYGMAYAVRTGLLPRDPYLRSAAAAWHGMTAKALHADGLLGFVQGEGDRPESGRPVTRESTADFGVGAFLLAGTELARLAR